MREYTTIQGEIWDSIAKEVYGDELYTSFLMKNNMDKLNYLVFPEGIRLKIVDLPQVASVLPDWRQ